MLIAAFSDCHQQRGPEDPRDDFWSEYGPFLKALGRLPDNATIIGLGDLADYQRLNGNINEIIEPYLLFWRMFANRKGIYLWGNHDAVVANPKIQKLFPGGITFAQRMIIDGVYYCHGNEWDLACGRWPWIGRLVVKAANVLGKISPRLEDWAEKLSKEIQSVGRYSNHNTFDFFAREFVKNFIDVHSICCGHTHRLNSYQFESGKYFINTGSVAYGFGESFTIIEDGIFKDVIFI